MLINHFKGGSILISLLEPSILGGPSDNSGGD